MQVFFHVRLANNMAGSDYVQSYVQGAGKKNPKPSVLMNLCQAEKQKVNEGMEPGLTQGEILIH